MMGRCLVSNAEIFCPSIFEPGMSNSVHGCTCFGQKIHSRRPRRLSTTIGHVLGDLDYKLEHSTRLYGHETNMLEIPILECQKMVGYGPFWHRRGRFLGQLDLAHHTHNQGMVSLGTCMKFERQWPSSRGERSDFVQGSICRHVLQKSTPPST